MARYYPFTETRYKKWLKEGRGTGIGATWIPWIQRGDFPSKGKVAIDTLDGGNGREIHTLSQLERTAYLVYICKPNVLGIEEQFPLDREQTRSIAQQLGIKHPQDPESRVDIVMTTDLMIRVQNAEGGVTCLARSVKPEAFLAKSNVWEHAEIERRYWAQRGIDWAFLVERSFPDWLVRNLDLIYMHRDLHNRPPVLGFEGSLAFAKQRILEEMGVSATEQTLEAFCTKLTAQLNWPSGTAFAVVCHMLRWHELTSELHKGPLRDITLGELEPASEPARIQMSEAA